MLNNRLLILLVPTCAAAIIAAACSSSSTTETTEEDAGTQIPATSEPSTSSQSETAPTGSAGTGANTGLPCDVQGVIENRCLECHSTQSPPPLLRYEDFIAKSTKDPAKSRAQISLEMMKAKEMPPAPALPAEDDEIAAFEQWVAGGTQKNPMACTTQVGDGGVGDAGSDGGVGDGGCTSGKFWPAASNRGSDLMHPGTNCNACHQTNRGPNLRVVGTVYPTLRDPNDCNGSAPPPQLTVVITDARNRTFRLPVNEAGNFMTTNRPQLPIKAMVTDGTKTRQMIGTVTRGDCNACHTAQGLNGAPGRILAP